MVQKTASKIIRTDKWRLVPTSEQKDYLLNTVREYRRLCRFLVTVVCTHWVELGALSSDKLVPAIERLVHRTAKNTNPKYPQINQAFHKFPSYLRRAAIMFASGQVSSYSILQDLGYVPRNPVSLRNRVSSPLDLFFWIN